MSLEFEFLLALHEIHYLVQYCLSVEFEIISLKLCHDVGLFYDAFSFILMHFACSSNIKIANFLQQTSSKHYMKFQLKFNHVVLTTSFQQRHKLTRSTLFFLSSFSIQLCSSMHTNCIRIKILDAKMIG